MQEPVEHLREACQAFFHDQPAGGDGFAIRTQNTQQAAACMFLDR